MKSLGGYFEFEIMNKSDFIHHSAILLNSGRNCFAYILRTLKIKKIYLSSYNCDVIVEVLKQLGIDYFFYSINVDLEITDEIVLQNGEYLLYVNYFGIKEEYTIYLSTLYSGKLIIDNSQSFYSVPINKVSTFYSPRKFFGVPDGGCLYLPNQHSVDLRHDLSYEQCVHLLKRIDLGAEKAYPDYLDNEKEIANKDILLMSNLTKSLLDSIDYQLVKQKRLTNFQSLHSNLISMNHLQIKVESLVCPLVYPLLINNSSLRQKLLLQKIYVATYWPNVFEWVDVSKPEYYLASNLLPIPIDQRYDITDMNRILEVIYG